MKKFLILALSLTLPLSMLASVSAEDSTSPVAETKVEIKKPSLTFYYYDK